jgi:hypothetical protein
MTKFVESKGGVWVEIVLHGFTGGSDGAAPVGDLIRIGGDLSGVTSGGGGSLKAGTVFEIFP